MKLAIFKVNIVRICACVLELCEGVRSLRTVMDVRCYK